MKKQTLIDHINAFGDAKGTGNAIIINTMAQALSSLLIQLPDNIATQAEIDAAAAAQGALAVPSDVPAPGELSDAE